MRGHIAIALVLLAGCPASPDVESVTMRRLNRTEYNHTVRDLLGTSLTPADDFPADDFGNGFDNQGEVLSIAPLHLEAWEAAADLVLEDVLRVTVDEEVWFFEAESEDVDTSTGVQGGEGWNLYANGSATAWVELPADGAYRLTARLSGQQGGSALVRATFLVDGEELGEFEVFESGGSYGEYGADVTLSEGGHTIGVAFTNDYWDQDSGVDRNLIVDWFSLSGPVGAVAADTAARDALIPCPPADGEECAGEVISAFLPRAYRRPVTDEEIASALELYALSRASGGDFDEAITLALKSALLSPHFLFRVEAAPRGRGRALDAYELASRLSYFLWASMPDDDLFAAAADDSLLRPPVLEEQVRRMLRDPQASSVVDAFGSQWLPVSALDDVAPDPDLFPEWDEALRDSMQEQLRRLAGDALLADASMLDLVTRQDTWVDARLAAHLGIAEPADDWERVTLTDGPRRGVLGSPGMLTALSYPERTSPVQRGKWVLAALTCESPPPPPGGVDGLAEGGSEDLSFREQLEQHRQDPVCHSCHSVMDEVGFSMEGFGPVGRARTTDHLGLPVDTAGAVPGGVAFDHVGELADSLAADPRVPQCMARTVFTYAMGRAPRVTDIDALGEIEDAFVASDHRFADLAVAIALSDPFRHTAAQEGDE